MRKLSAILVLALAAVPARAGEKPRWKFTFDVPANPPVSVVGDPTTAGESLRDLDSGISSFLSVFIVNPYVRGPEWGGPYPPFVAGSGELGYARGEGRGSRFRKGDEYVLFASGSTRMRESGIPWGATVAFRATDRLWLEAGYHASRTTTLTYRRYEEYFRVRNVDLLPGYPYFPWDTFYVDLTRQRKEQTIEHKVQSHFVDIALKHDILPQSRYVSLMPTVGGRVWVLRDRWYQESTKFTYTDFMPERRLQDPANHRRKGERREDYATRNQTTGLWFAGLSGDVYPWSKSGHVGIGVRAVYVGGKNEQTIEDDPFVFGPQHHVSVPFATRGWNATAGVTLIF